jgi:hypothetical protein
MSTQSYELCTILNNITILRTKIVLFLLTVLFSKTVLANIGEPPSPIPGNITGDSYFKHMSVLHEELTIDMSGIYEGKPVKVWAKYVIDCPQLLKNIDLVFVATQLTESRYRVDLDNNFVNGYLNKFDTIPHTWLPPDSITWQGRKIPYIYTQKGLISFRIDSLTPGLHTLTVDYDADASEWFDENDLSITRTFVYILKPTDNWKSFNNFHFVVFHPANWEFSSNLELKRATSYSLNGDWSKLPGNYITIAIRKPSVQARANSILFLTISWIGFISLSIFWMKKLAKYRILKNKKRVLQIINSLLISIIASIFFFFIYFENHNLLNKWLDHQLNPLRTYGTGYLIMAFPLIWIAIAIITFALDDILTTNIKSKYEKKYYASQDISNIELPKDN